MLLYIKETAESSTEILRQLLTGEIVWEVKIVLDCNNAGVCIREAKKLSTTDDGVGKGNFDKPLALLDMTIIAGCSEYDHAYSIGLG